MVTDVKVFAVLPEIGGVSAKGNNWSKQSFVGETFDQYPRKICFDVFNPGAKVKMPSVGAHVQVSFDIESRSFTTKTGEEKWITSLNAWDVTPVSVVDKEKWLADRQAYLNAERAQAADVYAAQVEPIVQETLPF